MHSCTRKHTAARNGGALRKVRPPESWWKCVRSWSGFDRFWFELCTIVVIISEFGLFIYTGKMCWRRRDPARRAHSVQIHNVPFSKTKAHFGSGTGHTLILLSLSLSVFSFLFVALLVSLNKPQRFLGNGLSEKKKSYHGIFLAQSISPPAQDMGFPWPPRAPYKAYSCVCGGACTCVPAWARWACCANLS